MTTNTENWMGQMRGSRSRAAAASVTAPLAQAMGEGREAGEDARASPRGWSVDLFRF